jgi:folate-binding protein YgfZ
VKQDGQTDDLGLLTSGAALHGGRARELIVATGADRVRFLHGIVTGDVAGTPVGGGCRSALLTPKGHVVADLLVFLRPEEIWIVTDAGQGDATAAALSRYAIMDDFAATRRPGFAQLAVLGPAAGRKLALAGLVPDEAALPGPALLSHASHASQSSIAEPGQDPWIVRTRELGVDGYWVAGAADVVIGARGRLEREAHVLELSAAASEAARIGALEGRWGAEITPDYFPMEVGLSGAIDYAKGCYLGQEPIVRLRDRGHINWRLVSLEVTGAVDPAPGDTLESDAKPRAGKITSAGRFPDARGVALAMLHVSIPVGADVRIRHGETALSARVRQSVSDGKPGSS